MKNPEAGTQKTAEKLLATSHVRAVRCRKIVKTAPHCPNRICEQVCTTPKQINNFFTGDPDHPNRISFKPNRKRREKKQKKTEEAVAE